MYVDNVTYILYGSVGSYNVHFNSEGDLHFNKISILSYLKITQYTKKKPQDDEVKLPPSDLIKYQPSSEMEVYIVIAYNNVMCNGVYISPQKRAVIK